MSPLPPHRWSGVLSARRLILLATAANLAIAAAAIGYVRFPQTTPIAFTRPAVAAENAQRPTGFAYLVEQVKPAVISVQVKMDAGATMMGLHGDQPFSPNSGVEQFLRKFGMPFGEKAPDEQDQRHRSITGQGSGFFISADGFAVTNHHVVDKAKTVQVTADDGKTYTAKVIGSDARSDLALIKVDGRSDFPHVRLGEKSPRVGDWVVAVGNPFGLGGTVTAGIVSARGRDIGVGPYDDFIQIDAPINKGNSGGPTFDVDGNVIGVNTAIFSPSGGSVGVAFAIPAETVKTVIAQLKDKGVVTRGWLGVQIQPVTAEIAETLGMKAGEGALVSEPQPESPAAKAGIVAGDVITAVNGKAIKDAHELAKHIGAMSPGATVNLTVWHKGEEKSMSVALGELPKERTARAASPETGPTDAPKLGLMLAPAGEVAGSGSEGVVVMQIDPNGPASERGVKTGDVILDVGGKKVATPADVREAVSDAHKNGKRTVLMRLKSDAMTKFVAIPIAGA